MASVLALMRGASQVPHQSRSIRFVLRPLSSLASTAIAPLIKDVHEYDNFVRLHFSDGSSADYHYFWLRHNCESSRHPLTNERTLCSARVPLSIRPVSFSLCPSGSSVHFQWDHCIGMWTWRSELALPFYYNFHKIIEQ